MQHNGRRYVISSRQRTINYYVITYVWEDFLCWSWETVQAQLSNVVMSITPLVGPSVVLSDYRCFHYVALTCLQNRSQAQIRLYYSMLGENIESSRQVAYCKIKVPPYTCSRQQNSLAELLLYISLGDIYTGSEYRKIRKSLVIRDLVA